MDMEEKEWLAKEFQYATDDEELEDDCLAYMFDDTFDALLKEDFNDFYPTRAKLRKERKAQKVLKYIYNNHRLPPKAIKTKLKMKIDIDEATRNGILDKYYKTQLSGKQLENAKDMEFFLAIGYDYTYIHIYHNIIQHQSCIN